MVKIHIYKHRPCFLLRLLVCRRGKKTRIFSVGLVLLYVLSLILINLTGQFIEDAWFRPYGCDVHMHLFWAKPLDILITFIAPLLPPIIIGFLMAKWLRRQGLKERRAS